MSSAEVDKVSAVATDVINKILEEDKKQKQKENEISEKSEQLKQSLKVNYQEKISESLESNIVVDDNLKSDDGLTKADVEELLNAEFKKVEALVNDKSIESIDSSDFAYKLESLSKDFDKKMTPKKSPIESIKKSLSKAKQGTKDFAKSKISIFINKMNAKLQDMTQEIDNKMNGKETEETEELTQEKPEEIQLNIENKNDIISSIDLEIKEKDELSQDANEFIETEYLNETSHNSVPDTKTIDKANVTITENNQKIKDLTALKDEIENSNSLSEISNADKNTINHLTDNKFKSLENERMEVENMIDEESMEQGQDPDPHSFDKNIDKHKENLKEINNKIDNFGNSKEITLSYEQKIEQTLRNDPDLFKRTLAVTQINSMKSHLDNSKESLKQLNEISKDDPMEQYKINDMKNQLTTHIDGMEKELDTLEQSHNPEQAMEQLNEQSKEQGNKQEKEQENEQEQSKDKEPAKEKEEVMER